MFWLYYLFFSICHFDLIGADGLIRHESRDPSHVHDRRRTKMGKDSIIPLRIGLKQQNLEHGERHLLAVSDPDSPLYGKHWTEKAVNSFFSPSQETVREVQEWLVSSGVPQNQISKTANGAWLAVDLPAQKAEALLHTTFYMSADPEKGTIRILSDGYSLPKRVARHVDYLIPGVTPSPPLTSKRPLNRKKRRPLKDTRKMRPNRSLPRERCQTQISPQLLSNCSNEITPDCLRAMYGIPRGDRNDPDNSFGIFSSQEPFSQKDLDAYFARYTPEIPQGTTPDVFLIDDVQYAEQDNVATVSEADLDLEIAIPLLYPQTVTFYSVGPRAKGAVPKPGDDFAQSYLNILDAFDGAFCLESERKAGKECGTVNPPRVLSMSYGSPEINYTASFQKRQCNEYMKLALRGHTVIVSSGDAGVASDPGTPFGNGCISPETRSIAENGTVFGAEWPQSCPYVLSVGGTQLNSGLTVHDPETALDDADGNKGSYPFLSNTHFTSGGGFSALFKQPGWQATAVGNYFTSHPPDYPSYISNWTEGYANTSNIGADGGLYNRAGRGFPDVSANGAKYATVEGGVYKPIAGTSLSAPIWGAILTLINGERLAAQKSSVGFVHPVLYKHPEAFNDIKNGTNAGCNTAGFSAVDGWDPVTGLGTPKFEKLLEIFLSLP